MILPIISVLILAQSVYSQQIYFPGQFPPQYHRRYFVPRPAQGFYFPDDDIFQSNRGSSPRFSTTPSSPRRVPAANGFRPQRPINNPFQNNRVPTSVASLPGTSRANNPFLSNVIANGVTRLGIQINNERNKKRLGTSFEEDQPIVFSPVNIAEALALVLLGAAGQTFTEIANALGLNRSGVDINRNSQSVHEQFGQMLQSFEDESAANSENPKLIAASGIFVQDGYPVRREYTDVATRVYKSQVQNLDFARNGPAARNYINNWVSSKTNGKIQNMFDKTPPSNTNVILVTALYFKGAWKHPFMEMATRRRDFYPYGRNNETSVQVEMMFTFAKFGYYKDTTLNCEILEIPYKGETTSMYIVVPNQSDKTKLKQLEQQLTPEQIERLIGQIEKRDVLLGLPKMRLESTLELRPTLSDLGINQVFDRSRANLGVLSSAGDIRLENRFKRQATLRSIDEIRNSIDNDPNAINPGLHADQVLHKVFIDITETGTEAAAATAVSLERTLRLTVRLDHPFMFFIRHKPSKLNLFWGSVTVPTPYYT